MNNDFEQERRLHPENFVPQLNEEISAILQILQDNVDDLDSWSADNGDFLNSEVHEFNELIKRCRRQLI